MNFQPTINAGGSAFGLLSDDRGALDAIVIEANKSLSAAIEQACPPLPAMSRTALDDSQFAVDQAEADVAAAEHAKATALKADDFKALAKADTVLDTAQAALSKAKNLKCTVSAHLDQQAARTKAAHNAANRAARKAMAAEIDMRLTTATADFLDAAGDELRELLVLRHQQNVMRERINADSIAEVHEAAAAMPASIFTPPAPKPEDYQPKCEPRQEYPKGLGQCPEKSCQGNLCMEHDGTVNGVKIRCERCGADVAGHPLLQPA